MRRLSRKALTPFLASVQRGLTSVKSQFTSIQSPQTAVQCLRTSVQWLRTSVQRPLTSLQRPQTSVQRVLTFAQPLLRACNAPAQPFIRPKRPFNARGQTFNGPCNRSLTTQFPIIHAYTVTYGESPQNTKGSQPQKHPEPLKAPRSSQNLSSLCLRRCPLGLPLWFSEVSLSLPRLR